MILLNKERVKGLLAKEDHTVDEAVVAMKELISMDGCRRKVLGKYLDGVSKTCEEVEGARCDKCEGSYLMSHDGNWEA